MIPKTVFTRQAAKQRQTELAHLIVYRELPPECLARLGAVANWLGALSRSGMLPDAGEATKENPGGQAGAKKKRYRHTINGGGFNE